VYEDTDIFAFMDIQPIRPGQVLIIPKDHIDKFSDVSDEIAEKIFKKSRELTRAIEKNLKPDRVGIIVNGYGVGHAHMIVAPLHNSGDITTARAAGIENNKIVFSPRNFPFAERAELDRLAKLLS
jgi:histidine triad (HIT) family protein